MSDALLPPLTLHGWYMLTQFADLSPTREGTRAERLEELARLLEAWSEPDDGGWTAVYRLVGGGNDYLLLHLRPTMEALSEAERTLRIHPSAQDLVVKDDYLSVVELGLYGHTLGLANRAEQDGIEPGSAEWEALVTSLLEEQLEKDYTQRRLYPRQPDDMPWVCFYPMDKRRKVQQNWYNLGLAERARLMQEHGKTGRRYAGKVAQIITGSVGFADWEWAVTLFSGDPIHFKNLITDMRYDEVTAVYGAFGSFWVGRRIPAGELAGELTGRSGTGPEG
ncbi:MAG TPA: chlorite dismutase family protein [Longimicrobiales bacterium]|nr:chlorite dismutase family protein [Longimicrobiales bacterium]